MSNQEKGVSKRIQSLQEAQKLFKNITLEAQGQATPLGKKNFKRAEERKGEGGY